MSVTTVPGVNGALQALPQAMPGGAEATVQEPALETVKVLITMKVALILRSDVMLTEHVLPDELSQPDQPLSMEPAAGAAVTATVVP